MFPPPLSSASAIYAQHTSGSRDYEGAGAHQGLARFRSGPPLLSEVADQECGLIDMAEGEPTGDERRSSPELFEGEGEFSNVFRKEEDREEWASNGIHPSKRIASNSEPAAPRSVAGEGKRCHAVEETRVAASALISRIGLNDNKAGMQGIDKVRINQIILDASRGSKFYENELRKEKQLAKRVNHMLEELKRITPAQKIAASSVADREFELLEAGRDLSHIVVHIDMDAFYAAVEMRDNPHLRDVPMAVGSNAMLVGRDSGNR